MKARWLRSTLIAAGAAAIVAIVGSSGYDAWRLHQQIVAANERELGNLAEALVTSIQRNVLAVDLLLRDTAAWYAAKGQRLAGDDINEVLAARVSGMPQVGALAIVDKAGQQRYRSRLNGEQLADVSDRPYFKRHRDGPHAGLIINEPVISRSMHVPSLVLSRRIETAGGQFDGVVTATITRQELQTAYASINPERGSSLLLTLDDGTVVVRQPPVPPEKAGIKLAGILALKGGPRVQHTVSPIDDRKKLISVFGVGNGPLTVAATRDEEESMEVWDEAVRSASIRSVLLVTLVIAATVGLLSQLRRLERGAMALGQSEQRYAMAMEAANEGHAEWNILEREVFVSGKWRALHGIEDKRSNLTAQELMAAVRIHPDDLSTLRLAIENHLNGLSEAIDVEYRVGLTGDSWRWVQSRGRCVRDDEGKAHRLFCAANDITARKSAEAQRLAFEHRNQQAQRMEALGTLAGGIAHDFNNILGAILGFGDMAHRQTAPGTPIRRHVERVLQAGGRAKALVRRVLEFSRSGVVERVPVDFQRVVEEAVALVAVGLEPGVSVESNLAAESFVVSGDETQLHQVVMNLCTNAIQAVGHIGRVRVDLRPVCVQKGSHRQNVELPAGEYAQLRISDNGVGIPADVMPRIFDPFFTTKAFGQGTGLGLSVVHGIVADLGGALDVVSAPEQGTAVTVWLPRAAESTSVLTTSAVADEWPRGDGQVVMIVDDDMSLMEFGEELLAGLGYAPLAFSSGTEALKAFLADPSNFDAVLTDESMPGLSGTELSRSILACRPEIPVLMMSGHVSAGLEQRARQAGVRELLQKPLTGRELSTGLARHMTLQTDR